MDKTDWLLQHTLTATCTLLFTIGGYWVANVDEIVTKSWLDKNPPILRQLPTLIRDVTENRENIKEIQHVQDAYFKRIDERLLRIELHMGITQMSSTSKKG